MMIFFFLGGWRLSLSRWKHRNDKREYNDPKQKEEEKNL